MAPTQKPEEPISFVYLRPSSHCGEGLGSPSKVSLFSSA